MIDLWDVQYDVRTAGPLSRAEVFFAGCSKAKAGDPCSGCFNTELWNTDTSRKVRPKELADELLRKTDPFERSITFCGGEPTDQLTDLTTTCKFLRENDRNINILVYTYKKFEDIVNNPDYRDLLQTINILVDGAYDERYRIYDANSKNWILRSIGSSNQRVFMIENHVVSEFHVDKEGRLKFQRKTVI